MKYEVMVLIDPKFPKEDLEKLFVDAFGKDGITESKQLEETKLAYPVNNATEGIYYLYNIETEASNIAEFRRKIKLEKSVWRFLDINLDTERGFNRVFKDRPKRDWKTNAPRRPYQNREDRPPRDFKDQGDRPRRPYQNREDRPPRDRNDKEGYVPYNRGGFSRPRTGGTKPHGSSSYHPKPAKESDKA